MPHLIHTLAVTILLVIIAHAAPTIHPRSLFTCGDATYESKDYTCYNSTQLCPIINGEPTLPCGAACYSKYMYTCTGTALSILPPAPQPFVLTAHNPTASFDGKTIEACGQSFIIGGGPCSYCPVGSIFNSTQCAALTATNTTLYTGALAVIVPGGQQTYWKTDGSLAFTQAHSAWTPDLLAYGSVAYAGGGYFGPRNEDLVACPLSFANGGAGAGSGNGNGAGVVGNGTGYGGTAEEVEIWKVFAGFEGVSLGGGCVGFNARVLSTPGVFGTWQYT